MNHEIIGESKHLGKSLFAITVRLIPESQREVEAIHNFEISKANDSEVQLINKYFLSSIKSWSVLSLKSLGFNTFELKASNL